MKKQTVKEISKQEHYTLLLDEATDESNRSELSLIARVVENEEIKNHFLSLLELQRADAESIFKTVKAFMDKENLSMKKTGTVQQWLEFIMVHGHILKFVAF